MSVAVGSSGGGIRSLAQAGEGRSVHLYSDDSGNLQADFVIATSGLGSGLTLNAGFKQRSASDTFSVQVSNGSGGFTTLGQLKGGSSFQSQSFSVPASANINGQVTVRVLTGPDSDNSALDFLSLSDSVQASQPTSPPVVNPPVATTPSPVVNTPTPVTTPTPVAAPAAGGTWWQPTTALEWQWEIDHPLDVNSAADMGTGKAAYTGASAPATDPIVYDIDGFDNPASTVAALHALGKKVVCYMEVGAAENYRADYTQFPAGTIGSVMPGYSNEKYIDIRNATVVNIIKARIAMCASKGFDAIEPDIDESYTSKTGFPLTKADEETFMKSLTAYAHSLGLAMWGKNPDDTGDSYAQDMVGTFDAVLSEQCNQYGTCDALNGYKAVFNAEYSGSTGSFCPKDNARPAFNGVLFPLSLNGSRTPCK